MKAKELKVLPENFEELRNYSYTCFFDSKSKKISENFIEQKIVNYFINKNYGLLLRKHQFVSPSVWHELAESMLQERYRKYYFKYRDYILNKLKNGYKENLPIHSTCNLLLRNMKHNKIKDINNSWYNNIKQCGIQDQISFFFVKQDFDDYIFTFEDNVFL